VEETSSKTIAEDARVELLGTGNKSSKTQLKKPFTRERSTSTMEELENAKVTGKDHL
jgi:hypothetical protein